MKILFSPSEGKIKPTKHQDSSKLQAYLAKSPPTQEALQAYLHFLSSASEEQICHIFGTKTLSLDDLSLTQNLLSSPHTEAICLYNGVGYKALDFASLPQNSKDYLFNRLLIFSNLFGAINANMPLPYYNLHQGKGKGAFELKNLYKALKKSLEELLAPYEVLDLRAQAYIKAYEPSKTPQSHYQVQFLKNGKAVSHYAKFYRGIYARAMALNNIQNLAQLESLRIQNLALISKEVVKNISILTYEVQD